MRPRSPGATCSSMTVIPRRSLSPTRTASGWSASALAITSTSALRSATINLCRRGSRGSRCRLAAVFRQVTSHERPDRIRGPGAFLNPKPDPIAVDLDGCRLRPRIVRPEHLEEAPLTRRSPLGYYDSVIRSLLRSHTPHSYRQHCCSFDCQLSVTSCQLPVVSSKSHQSQLEEPATVRRPLN